MNTGEKIKLYRTHANISQKKIAELTGISESSIRKYEKGERTPKREQLQKIANALNISSLLLLEDSSLYDGDNIHNLPTFYQTMIYDLVSWIEPYLTNSMLNNLNNLDDTNKTRDNMDMLCIIEYLQIICTIDDIKLRNNMLNSICSFIHFTMSENNIKYNSKRYRPIMEGEEND